MTEHRNEKGELHRVDGPAVVHADGSCEWWVEGKRHSKWGRALGVDGSAVAKELREKDAEIERLREALREIYEVYAGSEGIPQPMTAAEGYLLSLLMEAVEIASKALKEKA